MDQQLETEMQHDEQLETETEPSWIRFDFDPSDFFTHAKAEDLAGVESFVTAESLHESESIRTQDINRIDKQDVDAVGLFTSDRLLSPLKHARAGALSIMFTRMETRFENKCEGDRFAYSFETIQDRKKEYYALYLAWEMAPDV